MSRPRLDAIKIAGHKAISAIIAISLVHFLYFPATTRAESAASPITSHSLSESETGRLFNSLTPKPNATVVATLTAYTSSPSETDSNPTIAASGKKVFDGMVAANWLPFGTVIKIPSLFGDKIFIVQDRMNERYGYGRLDVWLPVETREAKRFGVKKVAVEIYLAAQK